MTTAQPLPVVSLQAPKDVSIAEIEAELDRIWQSYGSGESGTLATRASTFTLVICDAVDASPNQPGKVADAIAAAYPCRIVTLIPTSGSDEGLSAQVSAYCPMEKRQASSLICCESIALQGAPDAFERNAAMVEGLMLNDLPSFVWWKASPDFDSGLFRHLAQNSSAPIVDSSAFDAPEGVLRRVTELVGQGIPVADLNWRRLAAWQELTAEAFDPPERRAAIAEIDRVTIDYERGNQTQALMYLGWLAGRLQWRPESYSHEGGDYDLRHVTFVAPDQRVVTAELAGIPVADPGEVVGDLIGLRLASTNLNADCCTVLCSESTGCMRMEAGGGAQSCRVQQVTPLFDQRTEMLLAQQLRRWGRDQLFEESMVVTHEILNLAAQQG
ncbi:OpcA protein [Rubidibacter lacunae KORDI 51-2]|uniref:OpcA protein n=1 Tax=Rubidibacter lacunae KORDI 51-2 TaxID=582515 RepID=U5DR41_9CHRO|nr:glucose-6-phosphate dehydrogenase assembly protein OpcA [Rubidibacter lacunae]ERN42150.1 OpcA protein [Rubidibacter lacunae KORDI 51-2]